MRIFTSIIIVCLMSTSLFSEQNIDDATLGSYLQQDFVADESMTWEKIDGFKERFAVTDDQLYRVLMSIYRDAEEKRQALVPKTLGWNNNKRKIEGVLGWLPKCGNIPVKAFLLESALRKDNDLWLRETAILAYLRASDAEESKDALHRFLIEGDRLDYMERLSLYEYARMVFKDATAEKKTAILNVLYIAVSDPNLAPWEFRVCDDILAKLSPVYAKSYQRFLLLKKHNAFNFPEKRMTTKGLLTKRLEDMEKHDSFYSISTNVMALKEHKFTLPLNVGVTNILTTVSPDFTPLAIVKNVSDRKNYRHFWVGIALTGFTFALFGIWFFARKR